MKEKPILFNTEMVRAILEGRKTVTRRVVKPRYVDGDAGFNIVTNSKTGAFCYIEYYDDYERSTDRRMTPPCHTGDIFWVRETWANHGSGFYYKADAKNRGSGAYYLDHKAGSAYSRGVRWHPSIHMPREAARIFLRVTDVRVERLQEITDREAEKEGIGDLFYEEIGFGNKDYGCIKYSDSKGVIGFQKEQFAHLWDSTIKPADRDRYGWAANPWVWVIAFERKERPVSGE